jgi:hypothetical protein
MTRSGSGFEVERGSSITINSQARNMNVIKSPHLDRLAVSE